MTEETQQNKIDLVKDMVLNECCENKYIIKDKNDIYRPNVKKKDNLLKLTNSLFPPNINNKLMTYKFGKNYINTAMLLILLYKETRAKSNISFYMFFPITIIN